LNIVQRILRSLGVDKGLAYVTFGNFLYTALGAILWFYLASIVTPSEYGKLNYDIAVATLLTAFGIMGFDTTLTTFVAKGISRMFPQAVFLILVSGGVLSVILYIFLQSWSLVLLLLGMLFFTLVTARLLGNHSFKQFMLIVSAQRVLTLVLVPLLFELAGINGAILGFAVSHLVLCKQFFVALPKIDFSISTIRPIKKYFLHSYMLGIAKTIPYFSDKIIIPPLFGLTLLGYYQFGIQILTATAIIPIILYNYLLPKVAKGGTHDLSRTIWLGVFSAFALSAILFVLMPSIVMNLFPTFKDAILSSQILLFASVPLTVVAIITSILMGQEKSHHVAIGALLFLGTQFTLIVVLGEAFGLIGLSVSMVVASVLQCLYLLMARKKSVISNAN